MQKINSFVSLAFLGLASLAAVSHVAVASEPQDKYVEALVAEPIGRLEDALRNQETLLDLYVEVIAAQSIYEQESTAPTASAVLRAKAEQAKKRVWINEALRRETQAKPIDDAMLTQLARERYEVTKDHFKGPEKRKVSHILLNEGTFHALFACVADEPGKPTNFDEYISYIQYKLSVGGDFDEIARKYSADTVSAAQGGALPGWIQKDGSMVAEFESAAFSIKKVGDFSQPVKTRFGTHLIRLDALADGEVPPFEKVAAQVKQEITAERDRQARITFMNGHYPNPEELDSSGFVQWVEDALSTIKAEAVGL